MTFKCKCCKKLVQYKNRDLKNKYLLTLNQDKALPLDLNTLLRVLDHHNRDDEVIFCIREGFIKIFRLILKARL